MQSLVSPIRFEPLEDRKLMALPWGYWPSYLGLDKVFQEFPWLDGTGHNVAVVDKGIDYWHAALHGNRATNTKSPRIINIRDYRDNDNDPFPSESEETDPTSPHGTGVAGILAAYPYDYNGRHYQGVLQNSVLFNLRTNRFNSQQTIKQALTWVLQNHAKYNITAINLTDFIGTSAKLPVYGAEIRQLWEQGVFVATPLANDWMDELNPKAPIGLPASIPEIYGTGGVLQNGTINPKTQRGPGLDLLSASQNVSIIYYNPSTDTDTYTNGGTGNSWGTPYVVGTAVLMQQIDPTIKPDEIMNIMKATGVPVADPDRTGNYVRLDAYAAIKKTYELRDDIYGQGAGNHSMKRATGVRIRKGKASVNNLKALVGAPDYYAFNVSARSTFNFSLSDTDPNVRMHGTLYNSKGLAVGDLGRKGLTIRLKPGTYYLIASATQSLRGTYSLNATILA